MKRSFCILFTALFILMSAAPGLGMAVFGESGSFANEARARVPSLSKADGSFNKAVLDETEDYFADRFAFRKELITAWAGLNAGLFGTSVEDKVVLGSEGWLYYAETLDDYRGVSMSGEELEYAARNLVLMQEYAESRGAKFIFTCAPNKNSLYPENMPSGIPAGHGGSNAALLGPLLVEHGVAYVDMFELFGGREETLYYRTDSHWTNRGAALAADALLDAAGKDSAFFEGGFAEGGAHIGDLYEMLYPAGTAAEMEESYAPGFSYTLGGNPDGGNAQRISASVPGAEGSLLCWRDSFGIALYPYLADSFASSLFLRRDVYDLTLIDDNEADTVIVELVERNLSRLASVAPILEAPRRDVSADAETGSAAECRTETKRGSSLQHCSGAVPQDADPLSRLYVVTDRGPYEACVVVTDGQICFSAYIDASESVEALIYYSNGAAVKCGVNLLQEE